MELTKRCPKSKLTMIYSQQRLPDNTSAREGKLCTNTTLPNTAFDLYWDCYWLLFCTLLNFGGFRISYNLGKDS